MCFAPQLRALFLQLNFPTRSNPEVFLTFKSSKMRFFSRRRAIFDFSCDQMAPCPPALASLLADPPVLTFKSSKMRFLSQRRAFFDLSCDQMAPHPLALASLIFDPPEPQSHKSLEKHRVSRLVDLFAHLHLPSSDSFSSPIFFLLAFSSPIFFLLAFSSLTLPTFAFPSVHFVRSLTSPHPTVTQYINISSCVAPLS